MNKLFNTKSAKFKYNLRLILISSFFIIIFSIIISFVYRIPKSDDVIILDQVKGHPNVIDWVIYRYNTWGGRFGAEFLIYTFGKLSVLYFQIASIIFYFVSSILLFSYYKLFNKKQSKNDYLMLTLAFVLPYLFNYNVLISGGICIAGSINYAWIVSIGLISFYPIVYFLANKTFPKWLINIACIICLIIASSGEEQIGALLVGFSFVILIYYLYLLKTKQQDLSKKNITLLTLFFVISLASLIIDLKSPGNKIRMASEVARWRPDFYTTPILDHIQYCYRWFLEAVINHSGFLFEGIIACCTFLLIKMKKINLFEKILICILALSLIAFTLRGYYSINILFNFYATWKVHIPSIPLKFMPIIWIPTIIACIIAPYVILKNRKGLFTSIVILSGFLSAAIMCLSPTMYGSGWRIIYVPSIMFGIALEILISDIISIKSKYNKPIFIGLVMLFSISFLYIFVRLIFGRWFVY